MMYARRVYICHLNLHRQIIIDLRVLPDHTSVASFLQHVGQGEVSASQVHSIALQLAWRIGTPAVPLFPMVTLTNRTLRIGKLEFWPAMS
jgi:hypothetical protein